jgi:hypothetical protein
MTELSGRVNDLEGQVSYLVQDLLRKVSLNTLSDFISVWNQQFDVTEDKILVLENTLHELQILYANLALDLSTGLSSGSYIQSTFETISQNLNQHPYSFYYSSTGDLTGITYTIGTGYIQKSLEYSSGLLIKVSLTGSPLPSVSLSKNFLYSGDTLTGVYYL